jgi:hypothetical protein
MQLPRSAPMRVAPLSEMSIAQLFDHIRRRMAHTVDAEYRSGQDLVLETVAAYFEQTGRGRHGSLASQQVSQTRQFVVETGQGNIHHLARPLIYIKDMSARELDVLRMQHAIGIPTSRILEECPKGDGRAYVLLQRTGSPFSVTLGDFMRDAESDEGEDVYLQATKPIGAMNRRTNEHLAKARLRLPGYTNARLLQERLFTYIHGHNTEKSQLLHATDALSPKGGKFFSWGDAQPFNLIVNNKYSTASISLGEQVGFLDWELACVADTPKDCAMMHVSGAYFLPGSIQHRLDNAANHRRYMHEMFVQALKQPYPYMTYNTDLLAACLAKVGDNLMVLKKLERSQDSDAIDDREERAAFFASLYFEIAMRATHSKDFCDGIKTQRYAAAQVLRHSCRKDLFAPVLEKYAAQIHQA